MGQTIPISGTRSCRQPIDNSHRIFLKTKFEILSEPESKGIKHAHSLTKRKQVFDQISATHFFIFENFEFVGFF